MNNNKKRPILAKGEEYIIPHDLGKSFPTKDKRPTFDEARLRLGNNINTIMTNIDNSPKEYLLDDIVVNVKMHIDYSAKSYHPSDFIESIGAEDVGSKKWTKKETDSKGKDKTRIGKEVFVKIKKNSLQDLQRKLQSNYGFSKGTIDNIRSIDDMYLDSHLDLINKFPLEWKNGRVEFVLHPFSLNVNESIDRFLLLLKSNNVNMEKIRYKTYDSGITFFSVLINRTALNNVVKYNPLRTARPIRVSSLPTIRSGGSNLIMPKPPLEKTKSSIKVGIFDGGLDGTLAFLQGFVTEHNPASTPKIDGYIKHGTGVAGAILYGELSNYSANQVLPTPTINVESFRVLPTSDPMDVDLYEVIDIIEDVVPKNPDIKVFNLSLGPDGAIEDDDISRFTYAIDELSKDGQRLFVVAVGNDGNLPDEKLCRVQSPSDAVNCIGVGAYVPSKNGNVDRASYSSYGDGREGCKIKPDFLEFGGDENRPFQLVPHHGNNKQLSAGTSFASPIVAAKAGEIIGRCENVNPLIARALLVHSAKHPEDKADKYMGHGILAESINEILLCDNPQIVTIYSHKIRPTQAIKLQIPFLNDLSYKGTVVIEWTIAVATPTKSKDSEDYTLSCIEDTFYPNIDKFTFVKSVDEKQITKAVDCSDVEAVNRLIADGWISRETPNSFSNFSNKYKTEEERRNNFKWDTIIKRRASMKYSSIKNPYLVLHAMDRGNSNVDFVNFAAVASVNYVKSEEDIYELTTKAFNKLEAINIKATNEVLVRI
ncbi:MAG: hypothetical protein BGN88_02680 [Clostridiales bacterium 43-6]|nr:MAG: hypothetical protein BGN88_02680 [Clostridiales bacterium 43-6]